MSFCSLIKGIAPKIRMLCFVLINSVILNVSCVWILTEMVVGEPVELKGPWMCARCKEDVLMAAS